MSRMSQIVAILSLVIAFLFAVICLLLYPLWPDISNFLSTNFPVMASAALLGGIMFSWSLVLLETKTFGKSWHYIAFAIIDGIMLSLLGYLLYQLGSERTVLVRQAIKFLPYFLWFGSLVLYLWFMPRSAILQSRPAVIGFLIVLAASALLWINLPFSFNLTSKPVVFLQDGGVTVTWGTNMTATGKVEYSLDGGPLQTATNQTHGLRDLGDQVVRVFIPLSDLPGSIDLAVQSAGIKALRPTSANTTGTINGESIQIPFPKTGEPISFVSFSDLHEQSDVYGRLSKQIPWEKLNLAVYNGDFLNSTVSPDQVTRSILDLPTGDRDLPRIYVRGNHETRSEAARLLDDWLLPNGGTWYQAFTLGNTFFIVLDGGEDKPDTDQEYSGLVDFTAYHQQQARWLEGVLASPEFKAAKHQIVLLHIPIFGEDQAPPPFEPVASLLRSNKDIDLMVNGHTHAYGIFLQDETGLPYPVAFSGGPEADTAAAVLVDTGKDTLQVKIVDLHGTVVEQIP